MFRYLSFVFLMLLTYSGFSQNNSSLAYTLQADSLYRHQSYHSATIYYIKALKKTSDPGYIMLQMAKCYTSMNKIKDAELWFQKAKMNHAIFSTADSYQYAQVLMMVKKRDEAAAELEALLKTDPNEPHAKQMLQDVLQFKKYYRDSALYAVQPLNINTNMAEFSPAFYKEGIVFSSAQPQDFTKRYHRDNTNFLNLYYSAKITDTEFKLPVEFDKKLDTRFHDGPASFYWEGERMIINRNEQYTTGKKKSSSSIWHLSLYDAQYDGGQKEWKFMPLPFNEPHYSFAQPAISSDGTVLYFVSNRPGGYGGNDIYRAQKKFGVWSTPFNVGPAINTSEDEEFPFFINNTLYFSSTGHGGLGGLDVFKSTQVVNGFARPVNLGFPVNSNFDDFSIILAEDEKTGYFSSARNGNDDLFAVNKIGSVEMLARIYDKDTKKPLVGASVKLITEKGGTVILTSDSTGFVHFDLPSNTIYTLISTKDGKTGTLSGDAKPSQDHNHVTHTIEVSSEGSSVVECVGTIKTRKGSLEDPVRVTVIDKTTGKIVSNTEQQNTLITFKGEKNHSYTIQVQTEKGEITTKELMLGADEKGTKTWTVTLPDEFSYIILAVKVFKADDNTVLAGAKVKVITFSEADQEFVTNENGIAEFPLPTGTAYMVLASKDGLNGMHSGMAEAGTDRNSMVHPVPVQGDPPNPLHVFALVTNKKGEILDDVRVVVTDKSGENIPTVIKDGVLIFQAEPGKRYSVKAEGDNYEILSKEIVIPKGIESTRKISIVLEDKPMVTLTMAVRVFKVDNNEALAGAQVKVISFTDTDATLIANENGVAEFNLPKGAPYVVVGDKDGYTGMHSGEAESGTDKISITHPVPAKNDQVSVAVVGQILNKQGEVIEEATVTVTDSTGRKITARYKGGILSFQGNRENTYTVVIENDAYETASEKITIPKRTDTVDKISIVLEKKFKPSPGQPEENLSNVTMVVAVKDDQGVILHDAVVTILDDSTGKQVFYRTTTEGAIDFDGVRGRAYSVNVRRPGYNGTSEKVVIPREGNAEKVNIILMRASSEPYVMAVRVFKKENNKPLSAAAIKIITFSDTDTEITADDNGMAEFRLHEGTPYVVVANKDRYTGMHSGVVEKGSDKASITHPIEARSDADNTVPIIRRIVNKKGKLVEDARIVVTNNETGKVIEATSKNGIVTFFGEKGKQYTILAEKENYRSSSVSITIQKDVSVDKGSLVLTKNNISMVIALNDATGKSVKNAHAEIIDERTGEIIPSTIKNGAIVFEGEKEHTYKIRINADSYKTLTTTLSVDPSSDDEQRQQLSLSKSDKNLSASTELIILNGDGRGPKLYLTSSEKNVEIIEKDGHLYLQSDKGTEDVGEGSLKKIQEDPAMFMRSVGLPANQFTTIQNIYFDHNVTSLDETDKKELDKLKMLLHRFPALQLTVNAHADDRGDEAYNLTLSRKRAKAISAYLTTNIKQRRIVTNAYGESVPAMRCLTPECSEEEREKNRRAEFSLNYKSPSENSIAPTALPGSSTEKDESLDDISGGRTIEGLYFKVSIGAYRYNHTLTFNNLKELGMVESELVDGIMYYYLSGSDKLKQIKKLRQQIVKKGITDASIVIFYHGKKITIAEYKALIAP